MLIRRNFKWALAATAFAAALGFQSTASAQAANTVQAASDAELSKQLSNPVSSLISVPFQLNYDEGLGAGGHRFTLNIQPVIPFSLSDDWNLISRTILPVIWQEDVIASSSQNGFGDIVQSLFLSPANPGPGGVIWGVGPVFLLPTASDPALGADTFGAGITGVVLKQDGPWTYGALANHMWDVDGPADINATFFQPFLAYAGANNWTYTVNSETTYDWIADEASVPVNLLASKLVRIGNRPVSFAFGVRRYLDSTTGGPSGWGARFAVTLMFPK